MMNRKELEAKVQAYLAAIVAVGKEHGFSLGHEDTHGSFVVDMQNDPCDDWVLAARTEKYLLEEAQP